MYQQVYCSPERLQQLYEKMPVQRLQPKHLKLQVGDLVEFQHDSIIYGIRVGERKVFPEDVAKAIIAQSAYIMGNVLNGERVTFCVAVGDSNEGGFNPLSCPAEGCKFLGSSIEQLGRHMVRKHSREREQTQNAAIAQGVANRLPVPADEGSDETPGEPDEGT